MIVRLVRFSLTRLFFLAMGLPISRYRKEVESLWNLSDSDRVEKLNRLLVSNHPKNSAGVDVTGLEALSSSPPLSKKQLSTHSNDLQSMGSRLLFGRHTAGTTGEPTHVALNRIELSRMLGVRDYCFRHYGVKLGKREARLWGRPESGVKSWVKNYVMNRKVFHPVGPNAGNEILDLVKWQPDYLYGYTSLLLEAAKLLESMDLEFEPPKFVVCTAESVLPAQKAYISKVFRAPVAEEYGSTEFDIIAFECKKGHRHLVNPWLIVEGSEEGGLISDVSRTTQDLVRYQLGDQFFIKESSCHLFGNHQYIESLQGRTIDIFFFFNEKDKVHIITFSRILDRYFSESGDVFSFIMVQNSYSMLDLKIDTVPIKGVDFLKELFEREVKLETGLSVSLNIIIGSLTSDYGKRNYFIQNLPNVN